MAMDLDYTGSTQFGGDFSPSFVQDGYATGEYASMSIAPDGSIVASYTNAKTQDVGTLVLANFHNLQGSSEEHTSELQSLIRNSYASSCLKKKNTHIFYMPMIWLKTI